MRSLHVTDERLHPADIDRAIPVEYLTDETSNTQSTAPWTRPTSDALRLHPTRRRHWALRCTHCGEHLPPTGSTCRWCATVIS